MHTGVFAATTEIILTLFSFLDVSPVAQGAIAPFLLLLLLHHLNQAYSITFITPT